MTAPASKSQLATSESEKKYVFYHQVKGYKEKLYHLDTSSNLSPDVAIAKVYKATEETLKDRLAIIRKEFELAFTHPHFVAHACWHGAKVEDIETYYEEQKPHGN